MYYLVETETGFVGRGTIDGVMTDDNPRQFAYTWTDRNVAEDIATYVGGTVVPL